MHPSSHRVFRLITVLATAVALLAMPMVASAHGHGHGKSKDPKATLTATALTTTVSAGQQAAFSVTFRNDGSDTLKNLKLTGKANGATLVSSPSGCWGSGASVSCSFDKLKPGHTLTLDFVFAAPASAGDLKLSATMKVDGERHWGKWNSWGKKGSSKAEFNASATALVTDDPNVFATWQQAHGNPVSFATSGSGGQSTDLAVPPVAFGYPAMVAETDAPIVCNGHDVGGFGQAVDLSVANGTAVSPHLTLTLTYDKSAIGYVKAHKVKFVHQADDGTCSYPPRGCSWKNDGFCFDAFWKGHGWGKQLVIRVELPHNGRGKGI